MNKYWIFSDNNGSFSWRSALTALCGFVFIFAAIGNLFGLKELPKSYLIIISGVILFYFSKRILEKKK